MLAWLGTEARNEYKQRLGTTGRFERTGMDIVGYWNRFRSPQDPSRGRTCEAQ